MQKKGQENDTKKGGKTLLNFPKCKTKLDRARFYKQNENQNFHELKFGHQWWHKTQKHPTGEIT